MASKAFQQALANVNKADAKDLGGLVVGSYLGEGVHDVVIQGVDLEKIDDDRISVMFADSTGKAKNHNVFLLNQDKDDFGYGLRKLWSGLFPDTEAITKFVAAITEDPSNFEVITGMKCQVEITRGDGFVIGSEQNAEGTKLFFAKDAKTGDILTTEEHTEAAEAELEAKAKGYYKSWMNVNNIVATNTEENVNALYSALQQGTGSKAAGSESGSPQPIGVAKGVTAI